MYDWSYFDKIYCISTPEASSRRVSCKSLCKKLDTLNILYNDVDIDINCKDLEQLENIKMILSNKMSDALIQTMLET